MTAIIHRKKYDLDRTVRLLITVVSVVVVVYVINYLSGILLPFLVGCLFAYMLNPIVEFLKRILRLKSRVIPAVITMLLFFAALYFVFFLLLPYLVKVEFADLGQKLTTYVAGLKDYQMPEWMTQFINEHVNVSSIDQLFSREQWMKIGNSLMAGTASVLGSTVRFLVTLASWLLALLYMFFVLLDYDIIGKGFKAAVPQQYRHTVFRIFNDVTRTMSRYFRGQALVSLFVGIIFAIEFSIIGLPMPIAFGLTIGMLNMVPYLQLVSIPIAAFLCVLSSVTTGAPFWPLAGWTFFAYCFCQLIQDVVLTPLIMKSQMGLRPAIIFLALALWSYVLGFVGLIIGLPLTTLAIAYYKEFVLHVPRDLKKEEELPQQKVKLPKLKRPRKKAKTEEKGKTED